MVLLAVQGGEGGISGGLPGGVPERLPEGRGEEAEPDHGENTEGGRAFQAKTARTSVCGSLRQSARSARLLSDRLRQTARGLIKMQAICDVHETPVANGMYIANGFPTELWEIPIGSQMFTRFW